MHFAKLSESKRLQNVMNILSDFREHSTFELMQATNSCAVHSDISELRANGIPIKRIYKGKNENGRQLNFYCIELSQVEKEDIAFTDAVEQTELFKI